MKTQRQELIDLSFYLAHESRNPKIKKEHLSRALRLWQEEETMINTENAGVLAKELSSKKVLVRVCAWCNNVLGVKFTTMGDVTHGVCSLCMEKLKGEK